ncbi:hypothetical protein HPB50_022705 [Hyalomma asiaticum]|uniref:Uncharacterized protein n=1 Tax=Hyalomma asiaticum TaxID=266040 RepID=A0ACB7S885_HYAAI|nr:hypothetical protein HPB50_022705 [Hyalomma asiaticum]
MSRCTLRVAVWFFSAAVALAVPSCEVFEARDYRRYTCREFRTASDFTEHVPREPSSKPTVVLSARVAPVRTENPFAGLEDTLRKLTFSLGTMPSSWSLLSGLHRLEELQIVHYARLRLTRDFNNLPKSLKTLFIADATLESIEGGWISDLVNLEHLLFRGTDLASFNRNWLPSPAPRFTTLDLPTNKLTSFPVGLGDNLPALNYVNVFKNLITTIREQDFAPIRDKVVVVDMLFNPVHCDCNVSFILDYPTSWHYFVCAGPRDVKDTYATNLHYKQLKCEGTA